ncbi:MAG: hypothetical protein IJ524_02535 [Bacteroidales bacterium]|nr:hypothetical protein [Bacteroidales bacterium]
MKKVLFALAIAGMFGFVACNNNKAAEEVADTTAPVECAVEEVADSTTIENAVEEIVEGAVEAVIAE